MNVVTRIACAGVVALAVMTGCGSDGPSSATVDRDATPVTVAQGLASDAGAEAAASRPSPGGGGASAALSSAPGPGRRAGDERRPPAAQGRQPFILEVNARCALQSGGVAPRRPASPQHLRGYAQRMLPRAVVTLGALSQVEAPPAQRATVQRLQRSLAMLAGLYQRSAAPAGQASAGVLAQLRAREAGARKDATGAGLPACVVSES